MKHFCGLLCLAIMFLAMSGQVAGQEKFITLSGKVRNAQTSQPVPYANIRLKTSNIGTASNIEGDFVFKIAERLSHDTILISCIGYKSLELPVPSVLRDNKNIMLEPAVIMLPEVTVTARTGLDILKEAIAKIPENYDTANVRLTAFYREDIRLNDDTLNYNESVLDIYKTYQTSKEQGDQIRIIKGRKKKVDQSNDPQLYSWISNIKNTAHSSLQEDLLKYYKAKNSIFNEKNFRYYTCDYQESIREGNRNLLMLYIQPKKENKKGLVRAKVYIDEASMAILKVKLEATPAGIAYVNRHQRGGIAYTITSKIVKARMDFSRLTAEVTYQYYGGKTYLNTVIRHWECLVNSKKRNMKDMPWTNDLNLLVTEVNTDSVQRFQENTIDDESSMNHLIGDDYDAAFWENYNILQPVLPDSLKL